MKIRTTVYAHPAPDQVIVMRYWTDGPHRKHAVTCSVNGARTFGHALSPAAATGRFTALTSQYNGTTVDRDQAAHLLTGLTGHAFAHCAGCGYDELIGAPWCTICGKPIPEHR